MRCEPLALPGNRRHRVAMDKPRPITRALTAPERAMVEDMFGSMVDPAPVRVIRRKWWWFQPRNVVMAPRGALHFHPESDLWHACFAQGSLMAQSLFIHEMAHIWQHQAGINLLIRRRPFCRYDYALRPGASLADYNVEQQAEIIRHAFLRRQGFVWPDAPSMSELERLLPFGRGK